MAAATARALSATEGWVHAGWRHRCKLTGVVTFSEWDPRMTLDSTEYAFTELFARALSAAPGEKK